MSGERRLMVLFMLPLCAHDRSGQAIQGTFAKHIRPLWKARKNPAVRVLLLKLPTNRSGSYGRGSHQPRRQASSVPVGGWKTRDDYVVPALMILPGLARPGRLRRGQQRLRTV